MTTETDWRDMNVVRELFLGMVEQRLKGGETTYGDTFQGDPILQDIEEIIDRGVYRYVEYLKVRELEARVTELEGEMVESLRRAKKCDYQPYREVVDHIVAPLRLVLGKSCHARND
jgi:hypothetical protein